MQFRATVYGQVYSMKNSKKQSVRRGRAVSYKHPKALRFQQDFLMQVRRPAASFTVPVAVTCTVYYPSYRQDLDCELVYDLLQKAGVLKNDRLIREKHSYLRVDRLRPRVEIEVEDIESINRMESGEQA